MARLAGCSISLLVNSGLLNSDPSTPVASAAHGIQAETSSGLRSVPATDSTNPGTAGTVQRSAIFLFTNKQSLA